MTALEQPAIVEDRRTRDGLAVVVDAQRKQISQLQMDVVACEDALRRDRKTLPSASRVAALPLTAMGALLAEKDDTVDWLIEDRFAYGSINLLAGKPKAGKSTLARYLTFCIATGSPFLGHRTVAGVVWYLVLEDKRSEVRRHFRELGATGDEPIRFLFGNQPDLLPRLRNLALQEKPACIVADTLQRLVRAKDLNDYSEVTEKLTPLMELARDTGAALILVHHAGKTDRAGIDAVLGSTALAGSVDNILLLNRTERYRLLSSVQRIGPDLEEIIVTLDGSGAVHAGESRHDADVHYMEAALLSALQNAGGPLTRSEWLESVEGRKQTKLAAVRRLTEAGTTITRTGAGTKNDPYRYAIAPTDTGSQVPSKGWEPKSLFLALTENTKERSPDSGSRVPGQADKAHRDHDRAGIRLVQQTAERA